MKINFVLLFLAGLSTPAFAEQDAPYSRSNPSPAITELVSNLEHYEQRVCHTVACFADVYSLKEFVRSLDSTLDEIATKAVLGSLTKTEAQAKVDGLVEDVKGRTVQLIIRYGK